MREMERDLNPISNGEPPPAAAGEKPKLVVIMGPTASGKSKLAVDLASHFPIEIINADSMQFYQGLDVLTNKLPLQQQNGLYLLSLFFSLVSQLLLTYLLLCQVCHTIFSAP